jgi:hypothetical protein
LNAKIEFSVFDSLVNSGATNPDKWGDISDVKALSGEEKLADCGWPRKIKKFGRKGSF